MSFGYRNLFSLRAVQICFSVASLALVFLFQQEDIVNAVCHCQLHPYTHFVIKKVVRVVLNDSFMLLLIYAWFNDQKITRIALMVQLVDTFLLLPVYLFVKLYFEGDGEISSPALSQLHRLIVNPTLMVLIIPAVYYHRLRKD